MIRRPPRSTLFPYTTLFRSLIRGLGPAVPVVGAGRHDRRDHGEHVRPDQPLVIIRGVVGAGHHHGADALLERGPIDVVGERHVLILGPELGVAVVLPGVGVEARGAHVRAVDHRVGASEVAAGVVTGRPGQGGDHDSRDRLALPGRRSGVDPDPLPPLTQLRAPSFGDVYPR